MSRRRQWDDDEPDRRPPRGERRNRQIRRALKGASDAGQQVVETLHGVVSHITTALTSDREDAQAASPSPGLTDVRQERKEPTVTQNDTTPNASVTPEQLDTLKRMIGLLTKRQDHLEGEIRRIDGVSRAAHNRLDALKQTVDAVAPDLATAVTSLVQLMDQLHVQVEPTDNAEEDDDQQPAEPTQDEQPTPSPAVAAPVETGQQPAEQTEAELLEEMRRFSQGS